MTTYAQKPASATDLYADGMELLAEGSMFDASFALWNAASSAVNAYAAVSGWDDIAGSPYEIVRRRAEELSDVELMVSWELAGTLFDNWLEGGNLHPAIWVNRCAEAVRDLMDAFNPSD